MAALQVVVLPEEALRVVVLLVVVVLAVAVAMVVGAGVVE